MDDKIHQNQFYFGANAQLFDHNKTIFDMITYDYVKIERLTTEMYILHDDILSFTLLVGLCSICYMTIFLMIVI